MKKFILLFLCMLFLFPICGCQLLDDWQEEQERTEEQMNADFSIHFIDVGQGDCILIRCGDHTMLIDAGENAAQSAVADYLDKFKLDTFDYVAGTHAHSDHIGSLDYVVAHFDVGALLVSPQKEETNIYHNLLEAADKTDTPVYSVKAGDSFMLGSAKIFVVGPRQENYENVNNSSIIFKVVYGETSFLLAGDAESMEERELIEAGADLQADVLKVGHHGSDTSTGYTFLREIMPKIAVIQVGLGNDYGHPSEEVMSRLYDQGATVYRTDMHGNVVITSDGNNLEVYTQTDEPPIISYRDPQDQAGYIGNLRSHKFHSPECKNLPQEENCIYFGTREEALAQGYEPCKTCNP